MMRSEFPAAYATLLVLLTPGPLRGRRASLEGRRPCPLAGRTSQRRLLAGWPRCRGECRRDAEKRRLRLEQRADHQ